MPSIIEASSTSTPLLGSPAPIPPELPKLTSQIALTHLFILEYRADGAIHHRNFLFSEESGLPGAIERAKLYCNKMRYRFIFCSPFLANLEKDEKRMEGFG